MLRLTTCFTLACLCGSFVGSPVMAQVRDPARYEAVSTPGPVNSTGQSQDIAFRADPHSRMTVEVKLGENGPYNFLVDTGADHTVVSSSLARDLKLPDGPRVQMYTISGDQRVKTAALGRVQFSRKTIDNVNAAVLERGNLGADGVLGIDSLRSERVTFDFPKGMMTIVPSRTAEATSPNSDTVVVVGKLRSGRLVLTEASTGGKNVSVVVDTGSDVSVGNDALRRRLSRSGLLHSVGPITLQSVTGHLVNGELMTLDRLEVGGVTLRQMSIVFADVQVFRLLKLEERPAILLGMNAIRAFDRVSIDFANRKFRVVLPKKSSLEQVRFASR